MRIPLWLKIGYTVWLAIWVPFYLWEHEPALLLWFCHIGNIVLAAALWCESPLLFSWQAVSLLVVQSLYTVDLLGRLVLGFHVLGATEYLFDPETWIVGRLLSLFHVVVPFLMVWGLWRLGYDRRGLPFQIATCWVLLPLGYLLAGPDDDVNWVYGPFGAPQGTIGPAVYFACCMAAYPLLLYLPSHWILTLLFARKREPTAQEQVPTIGQGIQ